ncbi:HI1450 family dsDNA-mimic protein [Rodentibacter caecimuris]|uniref:Putative double-stranded DNA mimic protein BKG89_07185 n=1 Tax=Rodentibacter caecimuris TaxID=1796644 RepID=A0ABX3KXJ1_9PAST|nr:hypothetical protein BKG89_07185 [Rodentibacter heylii]
MESRNVDPDALIDLAYETFLEMASDHLEPADIILFNLQFEERGAVELVETSGDWEQQIGVLIDPNEYAEVWVGLLNEQDQMDDIFAKFLISYNQDEPECHVIWKN